MSIDGVTLRNRVLEIKVADENPESINDAQIQLAKAFSEICKLPYDAASMQIRKTVAAGGVER